MVDLKQSRPPSDDAHREYMAFAADLGALYRLNARRLRIGDRTRTLMIDPLKEAVAEKYGLRLDAPAHTARGE